MALEEVDLGGERSFIGAWYIPDLKICDELIGHFQKSDGREQGRVNMGNALQVALHVKDSEDLTIQPKDFSHGPLRKYIINLGQVVERYVAKFPSANRVSPWAITESINIQYYRPNGGYRHWHCERSGSAPPYASRHLVWMTYLNDVSDAGGTEFSHQKLTVSPRKGLTLIWPVDWTHLHRGVPSPTQEKYIITGWFDFL